MHYKYTREKYYLQKNKLCEWFGLVSVYAQ